MVVLVKAVETGFRLVFGWQVSYISKGTSFSIPISP